MSKDATKQLKARSAALADELVSAWARGVICKKGRAMVVNFEKWCLQKLLENYEKTVDVGLRICYSNQAR